MCLTVETIFMVHNSGCKDINLSVELNSQETFFNIWKTHVLLRRTVYLIIPLFKCSIYLFMYLQKKLKMFKKKKLYFLLFNRIVIILTYYLTKIESVTNVVWVITIFIKWVTLALRCKNVTQMTINVHLLNQSELRYFFWTPVELDNLISPLCR